MSTVVTDEEARANIAANLDRLLTERGVSQGNLARSIDVSPMAVGYYRKGERLASASVVARIAEYFGVAIESLLEPIHDTPKKSKKTRKAG